jgi:hypothetical protein
MRSFSRRSESRARAKTGKALIVANNFLETDLEKLKAAVSTGYARGRLFELLPPGPQGLVRLTAQQS